MLCHTAESAFMLSNQSLLMLLQREVQRTRKQRAFGFKETVHLKLKINSSYTHPYVVLMLYTLLFFRPQEETF